MNLKQVIQAVGAGTFQSVVKVVIVTNEDLVAPSGLLNTEDIISALDQSKQALIDDGIRLTTDDDKLASEAVKTKIKQLIATEDPRHPFSDQKIVELLRDQNIEIARRTVAKYREQLRILSSSKRRQVF